MEKVTWKVSPSISPKGTHVQVHIDGGAYGSAWIPLNAEQAQELGDELLEAASWCRRKDAA